MPYFKLAKWDERSVCFRDGKRGFDTEADAIKSAIGAGRYRVSRIDDSGRVDLEPFTIPDGATPAPKAAKRKSLPTATSIVMSRRFH